MAKRTREERVTANGKHTEAGEERVKKRPKKDEVFSETGNHAVAESGGPLTSGGPGKKLKTEKRKEKNHEPKRQEDQSADIRSNNSGHDDADAEAAKAAKAERKSSKRAKKEQAKTSTENGQHVEDRGPVDAEAERKAAKLAKKAEKRAKKDKSSVAESNTATTSTSTAGSVTHDTTTTVANGTATSHSDSGYTESPALSALPQANVDAFTAENFITITDPTSSSRSFRPITSFDYLPITDPAQRAPFAAYKTPTPIQAAAWPYLLSGRDVIGVAETGSGKTLAFGVPCIRHISSLPSKVRMSGVRACIVSPTRELALQIHEQLVKLATPVGLKVTCVYGGVNKDAQRATLNNTHIIVATPGRLNDFIQEGSIDLSGVNYLVLDEADRMLDKGFEEEVRRIISTTPSINRQTLMFTATWPPSVRDLASSYMSSPVRINIGDNPTGELRANARIEQQVEVIDQHSKQDRLLQLLRKYQSGKNKDDRILVFCLYKKEATRIEGFVRSRGFNVAGIHGDLSQSQRTESLDAFKKGKVPILVATDVAARGLDIPAVKVVINVTFPLTVEDYVHRIGRTGRAGSSGLAVTLFTETDKALAGALINVLKAAHQPVPEDLLRFGTTVKKKGHEAYGAFFKDTEGMKQATKITFD
ncbi:RNA-dependent ATPase [Elasticomyces elasticus]|nr:RNA-dependent ATPase [Elasticomyces elasticus]